jgi:preprotein translocase subunit YajC
MNFSDVAGLIAMAPPAQPGQPAPPMWTSLLPLVLMIVVFYFLLIRPQQKKQKEHDNLLKTLKNGDKIVTNGGLVAVITTVKDTSVIVRCNDSKLEILKSAVAQVTERGSDGAAS